MRGARISPRVVRNGQFTARQMRQTLFVRSTVNLTQEVRATMRELNGRQLRDLRPSSAPPLTLPKSVAAQVIEQMADLLGDLMDVKQAREEIAKATKVSAPVRRDHYGTLAEGLGGTRDVDGNVIHVDRNDRPYVYVNNGEIVYVKVYQARITPKGLNLDAKCTVANPDGRQEVLLVEPLPTLSLPAKPPL